MSEFRCREHPGETVTWKGTGCRLCEHDKAACRRRHTNRPETVHGREQFSLDCDVEW